MLEELRKKHWQIPVFAKDFWTPERKKPLLSAFCSLCRELGYPIYEMDLIQGRGGIYASMRRSTNGGGEILDAEGEDDFANFLLPVLLLKIPALTGKRDKLKQ